MIQLGSVVEDSLPAGSTSIDLVGIDESPKSGPTTQLIDISRDDEALTGNDSVEIRFSKSLLDNSLSSFQKYVFCTL